MHQEMQVCSIEFPSLKLMRCEGERDSPSAEFSSSVHQYFLACNTPSLTAPLGCTSSSMGLQKCNLPGIKVSMWIIWMEAREGSSVFSRREIIILLQTRRFLREDTCNFLTPKHPSISLQTFYYVWNISFGLEVLDLKSYRNNLLDVTNQ